MNKFQVARAWNGEVHVWPGDEMPPAENLITLSYSDQGGDMYAISMRDALPLRKLLGVASEVQVPAQLDADLKYVLADAISAVTDLIDIAFEGKDEARIAPLSVLARRLRRQLRIVEPVELDDGEEDGWRPRHVIRKVTALRFRFSVSIAGCQARPVIDHPQHF